MTHERTGIDDAPAAFHGISRDEWKSRAASGEG